MFQLLPTSRQSRSRISAATCAPSNREESSLRAYPPLASIPADRYCLRPESQDQILTGKELALESLICSPVQRINPVSFKLDRSTLLLLWRHPRYRLWAI